MYFNDRVAGVTSDPRREASNLSQSKETSVQSRQGFGNKQPGPSPRRTTRSEGTRGLAGSFSSSALQRGGLPEEPRVRSRAGCAGHVFPHKAVEKDALTEPPGPSVHAQLAASISTASSSGWVCTSTFGGGM